MSRVLRRIATRIGLVFLVTGASCVLVLVLPGGNPPDENALIKNFNAHRAACESLRDMILQDTELQTVASWGIQKAKSLPVRNPAEANFPDSRYREYLSLLQQVGGTRLGRAEDNSEVCIGIWAHGFAGDTRHVSECWVHNPPANQVASLAEFYKTPKPRNPVYRHIDGDWYLWADW